jgi:hypothetical protein
MNTNEVVESYLEKKTMNRVSQDIYDYLLNMNELSEEDRDKYYKQLQGYRWVDKVCDLRLGKYTKCFVHGKSGGGGILVKIDVYEENISLLCKIGTHFHRYSFNETSVFQKLSLEEQMILLSNEYLQNNI